jgi:hypothetical protein
VQTLEKMMQAFLPQQALVRLARPLVTWKRHEMPHRPYNPPPGQHAQQVPLHTHVPGEAAPEGWLREILQWRFYQVLENYVKSYEEVMYACSTDSNKGAPH